MSELSHYDKQFAVTLGNTSNHPWRSVTVCEGFELRWIPAIPEAGVYHMELETVVRSSRESVPVRERLDRLWLGLQEKDHHLICELVKKWHSENIKGKPQFQAVLGKVTVVVGPDLKDVSAGMGDEEAFMAPRARYGGKIDFLVFINHPQPRRSRDDELNWLKTAITHELEHVWQFLAMGDTRLELPWKPIAEMCAVHAEAAAHPEAEIYLEFCADFLRRLPEGLLPRNTTRHDEHPYWTFPFIHHLEEIYPGIHREVWLAKPFMESAAVEKGPWIWLDGLLEKRGTTLITEWKKFCQRTVTPPKDSLHAIIGQRFSPRLPSMAVNLDTLKKPLSARWESWPLSAQWIRVTSASASSWKLQWEAGETSKDSRILISVVTDSGEWTDLAPAPAEGECSIVIPPRSAAWDFLFVHACVPNMRRVFPNVRAAAFVEPAQLSLDFVEA